jgi:hypothetical protein
MRLVHRYFSLEPVRNRSTFGVLRDQCLAASGIIEDEMKALVGARRAVPLRSAG